MGLHAEVLEQPITDTLEINYMPYAMSVIISQAIPEIDGFKPSHRKLLYTMYQMKLLTGGRTKSANVVGGHHEAQPPRDGAITRPWSVFPGGYGALLHPPVDSKGNFGKVHPGTWPTPPPGTPRSSWTGSVRSSSGTLTRTWWTLCPTTTGTLTEPVLLPTTFPNILVSANMGIAVGMASNLCGFNLTEVCEAAIALNPGTRGRPAGHSPGPGLSPPGDSCSTTGRRWRTSTAPAGAPLRSGQMAVCEE